MICTKKTISVALAFVMMFLMLFGTDMLGFSAETDEFIKEPIVSEYVNINKKSSSITISGVSAKCTAILKSKSSCTLKIKMELQKEKSSGYETVKTWTSSKTGTSLSVSESRNINALCDYRLKVTYTAGSETVTYSYDESGNLISEVSDSENAENTYYTYDSDNNLIRTQTGDSYTYYVYNSNGETTLTATLTENYSGEIPEKYDSDLTCFDTVSYTYDNGLVKSSADCKTKGKNDTSTKYKCFCFQIIFTVCST